MADDLETGTPFARIIKRYMWRQRMPPINPNKLATELGLSRQTVLNWLDGTKPRLEILPTLSEKLGIPVPELYEAIGYPSYTYQGDSNSVWEFIESAVKDKPDMEERERDDVMKLIRELREEYDATNTSGGIVSHEIPR